MSNGLLKGLVRISCIRCGFGQTGVVGEVETRKCPSCGFRDINVTVGDKPVKSREDYQTLSKYQGGKNMDTQINEKAEEAAKIMAEANAKLQGLGMSISAESIKVADQTVGTVGYKAAEHEVLEDDSIVIERSEVGKGFSISRNYSRCNEGNSKLKRFARD